ncbi:hypothetical protein BWU74_12350 [Paraburkholderia caledonica]|nr:hypothetical protein BWU74_12350 [Burkholderia sp. Bk]
MSLQATAVAMGWPQGSERRIGSRHVGAPRRAPTVPAANREGVSGRLRHLHSGILPSSYRFAIWRSGVPLMRANFQS